MNNENANLTNMENLQADWSEILSAYILRKKDLFKKLLSEGASVTIKFDWSNILTLLGIDPSTQPKTGTLRELIELLNDKEYLELINDEKYLKLLEEKDELYRLDIDLPF